MAMLSPDYTLASVHIIIKKIEKIVFVVNIISTILFLTFYGYMIYSRINDSIPNTIIYSLMGTILIVSFIFDIIFYKNSRGNMNFLEKRKMSSNKRTKRMIVTIVKTIVKMASLAYATYELIAIDNSTMKILTLILSYILFVIQMIIYFIAVTICNYYNYLYLGFSKDIDELAVFLHPFTKEEIRESNRQLMSEKDKEMLEEIEEQRIIDAKVSKINKDIKINMANKGKKDKKARLKRDGTETLFGIMPFTKLGRAIKARKLKKNNPEEK